MGALRDIGFEDWIEHAFSHEVRHERPEWFWDDDCDYWDPEPRQAVAYLTVLFANAPRHLEEFSDAQVAQGLNYLVNSCVGMSADIGNAGIPASERARLWLAAPNLFRNYLMPRCEPVLGHLSEPGTPLNGITYMWWDTFPATYAFAEPDHAVIMQAELQALREVLALHSVACQEAALHGLGHLAQQQATGVLASPIIDDYLARSSAARDELVAYARAARSGCVL